MNRENGVSIVSNKEHIAFNADVQFVVEEKQDVTSVHVGDAVYSIVFDALKKQAEGAQLFPGSYRLVLTGCVSGLTAPVVGGEDGNVESTDDSVEAESEITVPTVEAGPTGEEAEEETREEKE